jgi:hypothetical protein
MTPRLPLLLLIFSACETDVRSYIDEGRLCVDADDIAQFEAGSTLGLTVTANECISACPRFAEATCAAEVRGDRIVVRSEAQWAPSDEICIALCVGLQAHCTVTVPEAGHYVVVHGDDELPLELPATPEAPPCTPLPGG